MKALIKDIDCSEKFVLVFNTDTAIYSCHASTCKRAVTNRHGNLIAPETFDTVEAAQSWADNDESEKSGEPTKAFWRLCNCAKK